MCLDFSLWGFIHLRLKFKYGDATLWIFSFNLWPFISVGRFNGFGEVCVA